MIHRTNKKYTCSIRNFHKVSQDLCRLKESRYGNINVMRKLSLFVSAQLSILLLLGGFLAARAQSTDYTTRIPVGTVQMYAGPAYPDISTGWIPADGREVAIADFPELYEVIGCYYGCIGGPDVFSVPNLLSRAPVMAGDSGGLMTARTIGEIFGEEIHYLTVEELPPHSHTITDPGHSHTITDPGHSHIIVNRSGVATNRHSGVGGANPSNAENPAGTTSSGTANTTTNAATGITMGNATTGITVGSTGDGNGLVMWQPSYALNFMIWGGIPASAPEDIVITVVVVFPTHTPTPTLTPTLTPTTGPSPTPTATASPTGAPGYQTSYTVGGQEVLLDYTVRPVDSISVAIWTIIAALIVVFMWLYFRRTPS